MVQKVVERAQRVIMGNEPQLSYGVTRRHVRTDVAQNVFMPKENRAKIANEYLKDEA